MAKSLASREEITRTDNFVIVVSKTRTCTIDDWVTVAASDLVHDIHIVLALAFEHTHELAALRLSNVTKFVVTTFGRLDSTQVTKIVIFRGFLQRVQVLCERAESPLFYIAHAIGFAWIAASHAIRVHVQGTKVSPAALTINLHG